MSFEAFYILNTDCHDLPIVISIPHSGTYIVEQMRDKLYEDVILPNTDWYLLELFNFLQDMSYTVIVNNVSCYLIDVNRDVYKHEGDLYKSNLVYVTTTQGATMYKEYPDVKEIDERIQQYYRPYHEEIRRAIVKKKKHFKAVLLLDLHSFGLHEGADIILGDCFGNSCSNDVTALFRNMFEKENIRVKENEPFSGGYIIKHYGEKEKCCDALQIELWYQTYIKQRDFGNEENPVVNKVLFNDMQHKLKHLFRTLEVHYSSLSVHD